MLKLALLSWDQKQGATLEAQVPKFELKENQCMNIYNMHRMRDKKASFGQLSLELDRGRKHRALSFYSGFGEGGYGGNYGQHVVGVSEKIIVLFIPSDFENQAYDDILGTITSRLIFSPEGITSRVAPLGNFLQDKKIAIDPDELKQCMEEKLDEELKLEPEEIAEAQKLELCVNRLIIRELRTRIAELKTRNQRPTHIPTAKEREMKRQIKSYEQRIDLFDTERQTFKRTKEKLEEKLDNLQEKHQKELADTKNFITTVENEFTAFKISAEKYVNELNELLAEKIAENTKLQEKLEKIQSELENQQETESIPA